MAPGRSDFERTFPYRETVDQLTAIADTKSDMERSKPMDRLICGDVGFGKTEIAIRAAFKAALAGKQAAFLAPTTVLAQQHYDVLRDRMADFPIRIELLNRYRTPRQQREALEGMADGSVDIAIGTHRLLSSDVTFRDLGLLVVDEEQRFGVQHKERLRELYPHTDVLTLSATPIPRTLYMALTGARDMSLLETPPANRYAVETVVCGFDERLIRDAIDRELARGGQVYFLHNRIETIFRTAERIRVLCPAAKVEIGHGQMEEHELEDVMRRYVAGEVDVLVSTTIIESGLDIPNANTILIDRADRFGLADLYQLRGRVGRGSHKAYAYLFLPRDFMSTGEARRRIEAITQYSSLGAGFQIAMRDLEIRGAGSILGVAQSGHVTAIGFDLYCQLLEQAVARLKGKTLPRRPEVSLQLDFVQRDETPAITGTTAKSDQIRSHPAGLAAGFVYRRHPPAHRGVPPTGGGLHLGAIETAAQRMAGSIWPDPAGGGASSFPDRPQAPGGGEGGVHTGNEGRPAHPDAGGGTHPGGGPLPPFDFTPCRFKGSGDCRPPPLAVMRRMGGSESSLPSS